MATTTTNFGWDIPQSTDLVKDGATAIAALGQDIDTALVDLKGGTTGQILAKASNTDLDYSWITNDVGDITAVTAGTGISGGGTSGDVTITNSMATAIDAKGDLIGGTGADTFARLAVGANNTVLTADSSTATGLKWATPDAGGMTSIASGSLSGASVSITSISGSYKDLYLVVQNFRPATANTNLFATFNSDTATRYATEMGYNTQTTFASAAVRISQGTSSTTANGLLLCTIPDYANTTTWKLMNITGVTNNNATPTTANATYWASAYNQTSAITSIQLFCQSGNFTSGSYILYGVK